MKAIPTCIAAVVIVGLGCGPAAAWVRAGRFGAAAGGGGSWHAAGFRGGEASGGGSSWNATGFRGGTASGGGGSWNASGAYGGTASGGGGYWHATNAYGTTVYGSDYGHYYGAVYPTYHPPTVVNYYGTGCGNCGGWATAGAAAVGVDVAATAPVAAAAVVTAPAATEPLATYALGAIYPALPPDCILSAAGGAGTYYECAGTWFKPFYGANGVYYRVVPAP